MTRRSVPGPRTTALMMIVIVVTVASHFMGCAAQWHMTERKFTSVKGRYSIHPPKGWMLLKQEKGKCLISQHGPMIQNIHIDRQRVTEPFAYTGRRLDTAMSLHDLAETVMDNSYLTPGIAEMKVVEVEPASIDGFEGFRAVIDFWTMPGIAKRAILYGMTAGAWYYEFTFVAPVRHYFDLDANTFEGMMSSVRFFKRFKKKALTKSAE